MTKTIEVALEPHEQLATFAAGCFWSVQLHFQRLDGVIDSHVGYINGKTVNPTYREVCSGESGHAEAVQLKFDENKISYKELVEKFFAIHNPTTLNRQKNDVGTQYRSGIYYHSDEQREIAEAIKRDEADNFPSEIVTEIEPAGPFYHAEEYHQRYLEKGGQCARVGSTDRIRCYG
ncbi:peptide-methionine (S)-S-oxide reductase [Saprolegnia parasitica CBS 223.65]|uniref:peptide-methionine (S)-S-oxide reductase n=1 Tax=Saprolegnia parasitica (strain CBS 223.65) TaxID=695850 RepID=A0A067BR06_SAPPC|nr:peptide-methionine (S)-S-oxide reductase [Saprolegnia parasitica CBS 223.65]KDO19205.1 peptide-methionine (S)-S-oxide reductase [Saprolegnia parasitica CBS 223.65]|eukprot:XP_012210071.1 peptide-methionine (S)-S-oxide reductase [Saprolegnia parasitica CBS 223.65]